MVDFCVFLVLVRLQQFSEFSAVAVDVGEVQGTKVLIERVVSELIVDVKEESVLYVLRGLRVGNPVQLV